MTSFFHATGPRPMKKHGIASGVARAPKEGGCWAQVYLYAVRGAENAEIGCRIGAKSGAAFRRNQVPLSTEIGCRFAPIFANRHSAARSQTSPADVK